MNQTRTPIPTGSLLLLFFCCLLFYPVISLGSDVGKVEWNITADKLTRFENPRSIVAEGNVELIKTQVVTKKKKKSEEEGSDWSVLLEEQKKEPEAGQQETEAEEATESKTMTEIYADWMVYDLDLGTVKARGNIFIKIGPDKLYADSGQVDLKQETGTFNNASIIRHEKDVHLEGSVIKKTGELTYVVEDGWIITCKLKDNETPPWSLASSHADITDNGYAFLKNATFRIKDVPVMYTPYMVIPTKRTRQTGFLFPEFSYSGRDGFGTDFPFFLNISPSSDMTFYPYYMSERGMMIGLEYRYVLAESDKGTFMANYLDDSLSDPSETEYYADGNYTHTNKERYWFRGKADHEFGNWTSRLDLDVVSDSDYLKEFKPGTTGFIKTNENFSEIYGRGFQNDTTKTRENKLRVLRSWKGISLNGELLAINDVQTTDSDSTPLWKLPSVDFTGLISLDDYFSLGNTAIDFSWDVDYVNYWREEGVGGHRLDVHPKVSMPLPISDYLEATASLGLRNTSYLINDYSDSNSSGDADNTDGTTTVSSSGWTGNDSENRFLFDFSTEIGTTLARDFSTNIGNLYAWNHKVRPYIKYDYIPDVDQTMLPQFDSIDSISETNKFTYGINNFFTIFGREDDNEYDREFSYFKVKQSYDFRSSESDTPFTPVNFELGINPLEMFIIKMDAAVDVYDGGLDSYSLETSYYNSRGDYLTANYRFNDDSNINSIKLDGKVSFLTYFSALYSLEHSIEDDETISQNISLIYQPACWSVEVGSYYTPDDNRFMVLFRLANIGETFGMDFSSSSN